MTKETYNGWTNYATWRVNLEMIDGHDFASDNACDRYDLGEVLREYVLDMLDEQGSGLALDYARAFVNDVNWFEIARHQIEAYRPQEVEA
jgi:hypothetical protein